MQWADEESDAFCDHGMPPLTCLACTSAAACDHGMPPTLCLQCNAPGTNSIPGKTTASAAPLQPKADDPFQVPKGQLTFDSEGTEGGYFHSRRAHWPRTPESGVTIGRGYDMGKRSQKSVLASLLAVGVPKAEAQTLSTGAGKLGRDAEQFTEQASVSKIQLSPQAQKLLFLKVYDEIVSDILIIFNKKDTIDRYKKHGMASWETLHPTLKDILVDLTYRGDYDWKTRYPLQPLLIKNDLHGMLKLLSDKDRMDAWGVPDDRFARRVAYLKSALEAEKARL